METAHPYPLEPGGRVLAAIAFTDVVSFSVRVREEEGPTLLRLEEDFAVMRKCCEEFEGSVLKSTGDGLLLYFPSAVQAVRCVLRIQRAFGARPAESQPLRHRIGVHLGDVFVKDDDVMGDGVNVAARLQGAADPGGICISQTVYDVIKGKVELEVDRLLAPDVKGAAVIGPMYRVLLAPRKIVPFPVEYRPPPVPERPLLSGAGKWVVLGIVAMGAVYLARNLIDSRQGQVDFNQEATKREQIDKEASRLTPQAGAAAPKPVSEIDFLAWVAATVGKASQTAPLSLDGLTAVYLDGQGRYVIGSRNMTVMRAPRAWDALAAAEREKIVVGALSYANPGPSPEVLEAAAAYADSNPPATELVAALRRLRR